MNGEVLGKTAIITGGASGMGLLTGKRMYEDGANVVLVDCDGAALENVKSEFTGGGRKAKSVYCGSTRSGRRSACVGARRNYAYAHARSGSCERNREPRRGLRKDCRLRAKYGRRCGDLRYDPRT